MTDNEYELMVSFGYLIDLISETCECDEIAYKENPYWAKCIDNWRGYMDKYGVDFEKRQKLISDQIKTKSGLSYNKKDLPKLHPMQTIFGAMFTVDFPMDFYGKAMEKPDSES